MPIKLSKLIITFAVTGIALSLAACGDQSGHMGAQRIPSSFSSNGERIYFTARSNRDTLIQSEGGGGHMQMMGGGGACASCHGADRKGGIRMMPYFWVTTPPVTAQALFAEHEEDNDGHGDHDQYDDASLSRAIRTGIDPSGETLHRVMPRWKMSDEDMGDLLSYLKS